MPKANQLLKYIPEAVPTLNSNDNICIHDAKNTISCRHTIITNKDDLANSTFKYETQYRGNIRDIHNGVGDRYAQLADMRALPFAIFSPFFL